ncbi:unnamed protein product, partial [Candidula unifasciata]
REREGEREMWSEREGGREGERERCVHWYNTPPPSFPSPAPISLLDIISGNSRGNNHDAIRADNSTRILKVAGQFETLFAFRFASLSKSFETIC